MQVILLILVQAPRAVLSGLFEPDEDTIVRGWPARVVGVLLLSLVGAIVTDVLFGTVEGLAPYAKVYFVARLFGFFAIVIACAVICIVYREKHTRADRRRINEARNASKPLPPNPWGEDSGGPSSKPWHSRD